MISFFSLRIALFLFCLAENNWIEFQNKCVIIPVLHQSAHSAGWSFYSLRDFPAFSPLQSVWSLTWRRSGISLQRFSSVRPVPSAAHRINASDSPGLTQRQLAVLGTSHPDLRLPHPGCDAAFAIPHIQQSYRRWSRCSNELCWLQGAGGSSLTTQS